MAKATLNDVMTLLAERLDAQDEAIAALSSAKPKRLHGKQRAANGEQRPVGGYDVNLEPVVIPGGCTPRALRKIETWAKMGNSKALKRYIDERAVIEDNREYARAVFAHVFEGGRVKAGALAASPKGSPKARAKSGRKGKRARK